MWLQQATALRKSGIFQHSRAVTVAAAIKIKKDSERGERNIQWDFFTFPVFKFDLTPQHIFLKWKKLIK